MSNRTDVRDADWPLRPWAMAAICALAGLAFDVLIDSTAPAGPSAARQAAASFVVIAAGSFVITVEQRRWLWSLGFALGWGTVVALVGWFTASYNSRPTIFEWPFLSGLFAVLLAAPLFQTLRDEGAWRFPYARLHRHAWTDAVIGAAALGFVGVTFLLAWLIAGLFDLIGIDLVKDLLKESWFGWMLAGFAFGAAVGLLRERDALLATLQRLVMVVLGVLAPVLAAALILFLASLPFTGLGGLWESALPATGLMLLAGAGAVLLANAVIGNGADDRATSRALRISALVLVLTVLPLAIIAGVSLGQRIGQYGWTPERIWGLVAVAVAIAYGAVGWWTVAKRRENFDELLRRLQTRLALGMCGLALFLALPIVDFGAISASSQLARLESGKVKAEEFDWTAMAFDFGGAGRNHLAEIQKSGLAGQRELAKAALKSENRYSLGTETKSVAQQARLDQYLLVLSPDIDLTPKLTSEITKGWQGCNDRPCALVRIDRNRLLLVTSSAGNDIVSSRIIYLDSLGKDQQELASKLDRKAAVEGVDLKSVPIEIRAVQRRQLFVDGKPVDDPFE